MGKGKGLGKRPETPDDVGTDKTKVKGQLGKGTVVGTYFLKGEPPKGTAQAEYTEVQRIAAEEALDALQKQKIPASRRDYVRGYFDDIRLEKAGGTEKK